MAYIIQSSTDVDPDAPILSMDGVGAFDLISLNSMMQAGVSTGPHRHVERKTKRAQQKTLHNGRPASKEIQ